ncbi:MAG: apolipoprotein N-acyltransferase [Gammaproteobacteria bacterium]|nr:apolipoprotein N-acyltransferase [Gammaproteobacteria bacterium]
MRYLLVLALGALLPLSFAPFSLWPLGLVSVAGWFYILEKRTKNVLLEGWLFGVGKYGVGASWIFVSIHEYGNAPIPLAVFVVALFVGGMALFPMLNAWLYRRVRNSSMLANAWLLAVFWVAFEWLLTWFLTGFPWLGVGYAHLATPLANFAPVGGVLLVSLAAISSVSFAVAGFYAEDKRLPLSLALLPWLLAGSLSMFHWVDEGESFEAALVQGNIDQAVKWLPESRGPIIDEYLELSAPHWGVDLMIWPEAAVTLFQHQATDLLAMLDERGLASGTALILGIPGANRMPDGGIVFRNMAVGVGEASGRYVKQHLVPFGEYIPLENWLRGIIEIFDLPMSHGSAGDPQQPLLAVKGAKAAMAICYEVIYPELVREQAGRADVLLTISNDTWFGESIGPLQHMEMARMRALENGRWLLRGTNNGVTAIVDHRGRVRHRLPQFSAGVLRGSYRLMTGRTLYSRFGGAPALILALLCAVVFTWRPLQPEIAEVP